MRYSTPTTREQRKALKRVFDRDQLFLGPDNMRTADRVTSIPNKPGFVGPINYKTFRKLAAVTRDCMMVPWCGMWLGIEQDGYTHS